jgi:hypothetical protein
VTPAGIISTLAGNGTEGYSGDGGPATAAELHQICGMVVNASGNMFIDDELNNRLREVTPCPDTNILSSVSVITQKGVEAHLYPNPSNGYMHLVCKGLNSDKAELRVIDMLGNVVNSSDLKGNDDEWILNENSLSNGMYFYQLLNDNGIVATGKFVIVK